MKMHRVKIVALATGVGVLAVVVLMGVYWRDIAAWAKFVYLFESIGRNEQGYPEYRHRQTGIVMVRVLGGPFGMGTSTEEGERIVREFVKESDEQTIRMSWLSAEQPRHRVVLNPFLIGKFEVSQELPTTTRFWR